jgi:DNA-formamidopyrimidine glycosylase
MPEGPEVKIVSGQLRSIIDHNIMSIWIADSKFMELGTIKLPATITDVTCYGKRILIHLGSSVMVSFLGMEGRWSFKEAKHTRVKLELRSKAREYAPGFTLTIIKTLYFDDSRHFGYLKVLDHKSLETYLSNFGPDILSSEVDAIRWQSIIKGRRKIADILLDQKTIAGIGNYLKSDILYASKINPTRTGDSLSVEEKERLRVSAHQLIRLSYKSNGLTLKSYWDVHGQRGNYIPLVYGKNVDTNGNVVIKDTSRSRSTYWVREVQI